ncbi:MAG: hypothetical protein HY360_25955 [Verrucomicrobia bacterium]|nr:hypothetical protein [Verrucomicrobiota bacterium]
MPASIAYIAGMKEMQYTLRRVPPSVNEALRRKARQDGRSLNETALETLKRGMGMTEECTLYHDLDDLAGSWRKDPKCEKAIGVQDRVDPGIWK